MTDLRKKDLKSKIHIFGFFKGSVTFGLDTLSRRSGNDKWEKYVHKTYMNFLQKKS